MKKVSSKQLEANRRNAKLGGVKTDLGKGRSKYNAVKHNLLTNLLDEDESKEANAIKNKLEIQFCPVGIAEDMLIERMAVWLVRLQRAIRAETEQVKAIADPRVVKEVSILPFHDFQETQVLSEGYKPKITEQDIQILASTYFRYETAIERNLYRALHELQRLQASRLAEGKTQPPIAIDIDIQGGDNGFVSQ